MLWLILWLFILTSLAHICTMIVMVRTMMGMTETKPFEKTKAAVETDIKSTFWRDFVLIFVCIATGVAVAYQVAICVAASFLCICFIYAVMCYVCEKLNN